VEIDIDNLATVFPKRCEASIVVSPSIYVTGTGFGVTWRITYAKVSPPQRTTAADVFRDEIEEEQRTAVAAPAVIEESAAPAYEEDSQPQEEVTVPVVAAPAPAAPASRRKAKVSAAV
jgi:hypothetical protein